MFKLYGMRLNTIIVLPKERTKKKSKYNTKKRITTKEQERRQVWGKGIEEGHRFTFRHSLGCS